MRRVEQPHLHRVLEHVDTGFKYVDVDSIAAICTPWSSSHCLISRSGPVVVLNVRTLVCRVLRRAPGVRTHTATEALATSNPDTRSNSTSVAATSLHTRRPSRDPFAAASPGGTSAKSQTHGLEATLRQTRGPRAMHLNEPRPHHCVTTSPDDTTSVEPRKPAPAPCRADPRFSSPDREAPKADSYTGP